MLISVVSSSIYGDNCVFLHRSVNIWYYINGFPNIETILHSLNNQLVMVYYFLNMLGFC